MKRKIFTTILAAIAAGNLFFVSPAHAEVKNYDGVGEYIMSDFETPDVAKQRAKLYAERNAQEQAGVYVKSYSKMSNFELVADEIESMTSGILKIISVNYKMIPMEEYGGIMYRALIVASIDSDNVDEWISRSLSERESLVEKNLALQKQLEEQERLIAKLKSEAQRNNSPENREKLQQEFSAADKIFMSNVQLEEGNRLVLINSDWAYEKALNCWTEAIELNPQNALAYEARGYYFLYYTRSYSESLNDYMRAIKLRPDNAENYFYRGTCYLNLNDLDSAKTDFERAISLNPQMSAPYGELAFIYVPIDPLKAIEFADRALEFDNRNWRAYYSRGLALFTMHNYEAALEDAKEALRWGCGDAYQLIGDCYGMMGNREEAEKYWELAKDPPAFG
ncbi:MAG: tetratricopeptide repeat protein [Selenomonadaceae bacterium]|nr:tetratricopeptide repeat protein [Selenomonadaceae bacterium]